MATIEYWIQLENHPWDVCPNNIDRMSGQNLKDREGKDPATTSLSSDVFVPSGSEDLIPVASPSPAITQYRPRTAKVCSPALTLGSQKQTTVLQPCYGTPASAGKDGATIAAPDDSRVFARKLTNTMD